MSRALELLRARARGILSTCCCWLLVFSPNLATAQEAAPQEPPKFTINIVRGKDAQNNLKKGRATSEVVVEVRDRNDKPVGGAIVTFALPKGTGGVFANGAQTATVNTASNGQAVASYTARGKGTFHMNVSVNHQGQTLTTTVTQTNLAAVGAGIGLVTALAIGAAAAAVVAVVVIKTTGGDKTKVGLGTPRLP